LSVELIVFTSSNQKKRFPIESIITFIGSNPSADIVISLKGIAPHQCTVFRCVDLYAVSNQSTDIITRLNGKLIQSMPLSHSDVVTFGGKKFPRLKFALSNVEILTLQSKLKKSGLHIEKQAEVQSVAEQLNAFKFHKGEGITGKALSYKPPKKLAETVNKFVLSSIYNCLAPETTFVDALECVAEYFNAGAIDFWALDRYTLEPQQVFAYKAGQQKLVTRKNVSMPKSKLCAIKHSLLLNNAVLYKRKTSKSFFLCIPLRSDDFFAGAIIIEKFPKKLIGNKSLLIDSIILANLIVNIFKPHDLLKKIKVKNGLNGNLQWQSIFYRRVDEIVHFVKNVF
jgi:hypothetical protein